MEKEQIRHNLIEQIVRDSFDNEIIDFANDPNEYRLAFNFVIKPEYNTSVVKIPEKLVKEIVDKIFSDTQYIDEKELINYFEEEKTKNLIVNSFINLIRV